MTSTNPPQSDHLIFFVNGKKVVEKHADPEVTLLFYLRKVLCLTGTKYGCGTGGCGACTVMISKYNPITKKIRHYSATACLVPICSLHGAAVTTVEGIGSIKTRIHPVQERLAKCHGTQCGFCSPGMVMSIYTLLRNHPDPSTEQLMEALGGNLCRCTGYRPIVESGKTFCEESTICQLQGTGKCCMEKEENQFFLDKEEKMCTKLYDESEFRPFDPSQEPIFPPELIRMAEDPQKKTLIFYGDRVIWMTPANLNELLELRMKYPTAPLVAGNTTVGPNMKFKGEFHPIIISPVALQELNFVDFTDDGVTIGAGCSLAEMKESLTYTVSKEPEEKTKIYRALLKHLRTLAGQQIRNMATLGGHVASKHDYSDINPILAAGKAILNLISKTEGERQMLIEELFTSTSLKEELHEGEVIYSVVIPQLPKWNVIAAHRQAQRLENALAIVNAAMSVQFEEGTNSIKDFKMFFGNVGSSTVSASKTCEQLIGKQWNDIMLSEACRLVLDEIQIPPTAVGGMVEYKRTLMISFIFKFYLKVLRELHKLNPRMYPEIPETFMSALEEFPLNIPKGIQMFQCVDPHQSPQDPVGHPVMHQSGIKHATGEAVYNDDIPQVDKELHLAVVTSTRAHAKILSIDFSEALELPGVVDVITANDVPGENNHEGEIFYAENEVICVGQIVCTVAADTYAHAKQAADKVKISYEDMEPRIITIEEAIKHNSFLYKEKKIERGNVEKAFKYVDEIIEGEVHVEGQEHFYMETQTILVFPTEDKEMMIYTGTQHPTQVQNFVAAALGVPRNRIMCHMKRTGGAFGGKMTKPSLLGAIAAVAAHKTGHPIRFLLERGNDMLITAGRHPLLAKYKIGFMKNGLIKAVDLQYYVNAGCTPDESELVIEFIVLKSETAYDIPNFRCRGRACKTNLPSNTAFRGFGFPQGILAVENYITAVAFKCGLPTEKVREMNMYKTVNKTAYKEPFNPKPLLKCWKECLEKSSFQSRKIAIEEFNRKNYWKKKGISVIPMKFTVGVPTAYQSQAASLVHIYQDGSVLVTHGGCELGQGLYTKMIQVASRELKIPSSYIHVSETSTTTVPNATYTAGSMGTDINGKAVQNACQILLKRLEPIIKKNPKGKWEEWTSQAFKESINLLAAGYFRGYQTNMDWEKEKGHPYPYFVYGATCSEVEIDCLTGAHKLLRTDMFMDAAVSLNPAIDIGQVEGGLVQGMGLYTTEELKYSPEGVLYSRSPEDYKIPIVSEIPEEFYVTFVHSRNPIAIYSTKGLGEAGMFMGSSVFFAITDAVAAARRERGLTELFTLNSPATPEMIRMSCEDQFTKQIPRDDPSTFKPWSIHVS
ncbi:aldehyde oxidase 4-like isoform 1-T2 [Sarcophilus harrisii]